VDTPELSSGSDSEHHRPPTPTSLNDQVSGPTMPYTIFSPETDAQGSAGLVRNYGWGQANVMDPSQSDFVALRTAIIGEYANVSWVVRSRPQADQ
jgi:septin family protein